MKHPKSQILHRRSTLFTIATIKNYFETFDITCAQQTRLLSPLSPWCRFPAALRLSIIVRTPVRFLPHLVLHSGPSHSSAVAWIPHAQTQKLPIHLSLSLSPLIPTGIAANHITYVNTATICHDYPKITGIADSYSWQYPPASPPTLSHCMLRTHTWTKKNNNKKVTKENDKLAF